MKFLLYSFSGIAAVLVGAGAVLYLQYVKPVPMAVYKRNSYTEQTEVQSKVEPAPQEPVIIATAEVLERKVDDAQPQAKESVSRQKTVRPKYRGASAVRHVPAQIVAGPVPAAGGKPAEVKKERQGDGKPTPKNLEIRDSFLLAARTAEENNDHTQALHNYRSALKIDPGNYRLTNNVAGTYLKLGMPADAAEFARKTLGLRNEHVPALINLGIAKVKQGEKREGAAHLSRALELEPLNQTALLNLGLCQELSGNYDDAGALYQKLAQGGNTAGLVGIARIHEKQQKVDEAVKVYRRILALQEVHPSVKRDARLRLSQLER